MQSFLIYLLIIIAPQLASCQEKLSSEAWQSIADIYANILQHPYHQQLRNGSLPISKFAYYHQQGNLFMQADTVCQALIAINITDHNSAYFRYYRAQVHSYLEYAQASETLAQQQQMPQFYHITPATLDYSTYLVNICANRAYPVAIAAILPCLWIYKELGGYLADHTVPDNPYQPWIDIIYGNGTGKVESIDIFDRLGEQAGVEMRVEMLAAFKQSAEFEYRFFDDAYHLQQLFPN